MDERQPPDGEVEHVEPPPRSRREARPEEVRHRERSEQLAASTPSDVQNGRYGAAPGTSRAPSENGRYVSTRSAAPWIATKTPARIPAKRCTSSRANRGHRFDRARPERPRPRRRRRTRARTRRRRPRARRTTRHACRQRHARPRRRRGGAPAHGSRRSARGHEPTGEAAPVEPRRPARTGQERGLRGHVRRETRAGRDGDARPRRHCRPACGGVEQVMLHLAAAQPAPAVAAARRETPRSSSTAPPAGRPVETAPRPRCHRRPRRTRHRPATRARVDDERLHDAVEVEHRSGGRRSTRPETRSPRQELDPAGAGDGRPRREARSRGRTRRLRSHRRASGRRGRSSRARRAARPRPSRRSAARRRLPPRCSRSHVRARCRDGSG